MHATAVAWLGRGLLLLGPSGAGKSDLALRLIDAGAALVADDLVTLGVCGNVAEGVTGARLTARAFGPPGLIELRGQGVFRLRARPTVTLDLALELAAPTPTDERLPPARTRTFLGLTLPCHRLDPRPASATARIRTLLAAERVW